MVTSELDIRPEAHGPALDVDLTQLREEDLTAAGFGRVASTAWIQDHPAPGSPHVCGSWIPIRWQ